MTTTTQNIRVAGYTRVSTLEQARDGASLQVQEEAIQKICINLRL